MIQAVNLTGPNYKWPSISQPQNIIFSESDSLQTKITVDGILPNELVINNLLAIVGTS